MKICVLPGDGIGPEIMAQAVRVLNALDLKFDFTYQRFDDFAALPTRLLYMGEIGATLAVSDVFRRASQDFDHATVDAMIDGGFITPSTGEAALTQRTATPDAGELLTLARGAIRYPGLLAKLIPVGMRGALVSALYARYPEMPDLKKLERWSRRVARVFGERADLA